MQLGHTHLPTEEYHVLMRLSIKTFDTVGFSVYWQSYVSQRARSRAKCTYKLCGATYNGMVL